MSENLDDIFNPKPIARQEPPEPPVELRTTWDEGIIAKLDALLLDRFPITPSFARAGSASLVSSALYNAVLLDTMGPVKPNVWFIHLARSGEYKTPVINVIRRLALEFNPNVVAPPKFTPEGFTEYITGSERRGRVIQPHPVNFIIRDEVSQLVGELNTQRLNLMLEYLSMLWDGYIEGYYTRGFGFEGKVDVYASFFGVSTEYFLSKLNEFFFIQGLGNRIMWSVGDVDANRVIQHDPVDFFFPVGENDAEFDTLRNEIVEKLKFLERVTNTVIEPEAGVVWSQKDYELRHKASQMTYDGSFLMKQSLNILKLASVYAASRMYIYPQQDLQNYYLGICEEDMRRAIDDVDVYLGSYQTVMRMWRARFDVKQLQIERATQEIYRFMELAIQHNGLTSIREISMYLNISNRTRVGEVLGLCVQKGWMEIVAGRDDQSRLNESERQRFSPSRGIFPQVFKVTDLGGQEYERGNIRS